MYIYIYVLCYILAFYDISNYFKRYFRAFYRKTGDKMYNFPPFYTKKIYYDNIQSKKNEHILKSLGYFTLKKPISSLESHIKSYTIIPMTNLHAQILP